jgi:cell division protein FtsI/penicillin-binding protein 2
MSFGHGMDITMIQTASAFCSIINGGTLYRPTLINGTLSADGEFAESSPDIRKANVISADASAQIRDILVTARASVGVTGDISGYRVGGKTGTSETLVNGKYVDNQTIGTYLGFGGEQGKLPRYVIMVEISGKGVNMGGGADAKPIFNEISNWMIQYLRLTPKG